MRPDNAKHVDKVLPPRYGRYRVETVDGLRLDAIYKGDGIWMKPAKYIADAELILDVAYWWNHK